MVPDPRAEPPQREVCRHVYQQEQAREEGPVQQDPLRRERVVRHELRRDGCLPEGTRGKDGETDDGARNGEEPEDLRPSLERGWHVVLVDRSFLLIVDPPLDQRDAHQRGNTHDQPADDREDADLPTVTPEWPRRSMRHREQREHDQDEDEGRGQGERRESTRGRSAPDGHQIDPQRTGNHGPIGRLHPDHGCPHREPTRLNEPDAEVRPFVADQKDPDPRQEPTKADEDEPDRVPPRGWATAWCRFLGHGSSCHTDASTSRHVQTGRAQGSGRVTHNPWRNAVRDGRMNHRGHHGAAAWFTAARAACGRRARRTPSGYGCRGGPTPCTRSSRSRRSCGIGGRRRCDERA